MKNIVIIPCWKRAEFLSVMLDHIKAANHSDSNIYLFAIDRTYQPEVDYIAKTFPLEKMIHYAPNHRFNGNTYNVMEAYKFAFSLIPRYQSELIYLVEEDIFVGKDFFDFHESVQRQHDCFCVSAVRNQNDNRSTLGGLEPDPSFVYKFDKYQSLGVSWKLKNLALVIQYARMEYYVSMERYLSRTFPNSSFGKMWTEQDGLINRIMEAGKHQAIYPCVPRAYHAGFVGYNRKGTALAGSLEEKVETLKNMSGQEMNDKAGEYKDIVQVDLSMDYGVKDFILRG